MSTAVSVDLTANQSVTESPPSPGSFWSAVTVINGTTRPLMIQVKGGNTLWCATGSSVPVAQPGFASGVTLTALSSGPAFLTWWEVGETPQIGTGFGVTSIDATGSTINLEPGSSVAISGPVVNDSSWQAPSQQLVLNEQAGVVDGSYQTTAIPSWTKALVVLWNIPAGQPGASSALISIAPVGGGVSWPSLPGSTWIGASKTYALFPWVAVASNAVLNVSSITSAGGSPGFSVLALDYVPSIPRTLQVAEIGCVAGKTATLIGMGDGGAVELQSLTISAWNDTGGAVQAAVYWQTTSNMIAVLDCYDTGAFSATYRLGDTRGGAIYTGPADIILSMGGTDGAAHATASYELIN